MGQAIVEVLVLCFMLVCGRILKDVFLAVFCFYVMNEVVTQS